MKKKKTQVRNNCKNYRLQFLPFASITLGLKMEKLKKKNIYEGDEIYVLT